jgi:amino-acid N-acetyltransferase
MTTPDLSTVLPEASVEPARESDAAAIAALNNTFSADGLTLQRTPAFIEARLDGYRVIRGPGGLLLGCVALDEYSPSLAELISLAVAPQAQGHGLGRRLIRAAETLARRRGYPELFAVSLADALFLGMGFVESSIVRYPEKQARYATISRSELSIGRKFCFTRWMGSGSG